MADQLFTSHGTVRPTKLGHNHRYHDGPPKRRCPSPGCTNIVPINCTYCEEHRPTNLKPPRIRQTGPCELCANEHGWYESVLTTNVRPELRDLYRRTCSQCRRLYIQTIKVHNLNTEWAIRLITATNCELCDRPFPGGSSSERPKSVVDHDHRCCTTRKTCGQCVRGILCNRCNALVGAIDELQRGPVTLPQILDYVSRET